MDNKPIIIELSSGETRFLAAIYSKSFEVADNVLYAFKASGVIRETSFKDMEQFARDGKLRLYEVDIKAGGFEFQEVALFLGGEIVQ